MMDLSRRFLSILPRKVADKLYRNVQNRQRKLMKNTGMISVRLLNMVVLKIANLQRR